MATRSRSGSSSWYGEDLAWIHHIGHSEFAEAAAPWLIDILQRGAAGFSPPEAARRAKARRSTLVADIGCGSGVLARELTRAGFDVLGIDASPSMIALARKTAPQARFEVGSFADADIPPCSAIVATGEVFNYGWHDDLASFIRRIQTRMLVFDIAERDSYPPHSEHRAGGDDWSVISIKDSNGKRLTRRILTFRQIGGTTRRSEEVHELELYDRGDIVQMLRDAGFRVRKRRSYGRYRLPKGHAVYVATT